MPIFSVNCAFVDQHWEKAVQACDHQESRVVAICWRNHRVIIAGHAALQHAILYFRVLSAGFYLFLSHGAWCHDFRMDCAVRYGAMCGSCSCALPVGGLKT